MNDLLKSKKFWVYISSRGLANLSDSIYFIALLWGIQVTTNSVSYTSIAYSLITTASLLSVLFGPLIDRFSPNKITSASLFIQAFCITIVLIFLNFGYSGWQFILIVIFIASIFSNIFYPASNTLFTQLVKQKYYQAGNSIIAISDQAVNLIGFIMGGIILVTIGLSKTYLLSIVMMLIASTLYLFLLNINKSYSKSTNFNYIKDFKVGIQFIYSVTYMKTLLIFGTISNSVMAIIIILLPSMGQKYGSAIYYSLIYILFFVGYILGAILSNKLLKSGLTIAVAWILNGSCLIVISANFNNYIDFFMMLVFGVSSGVLNTIQNTFEQTMTPSNIMGRVMSTITTLNNVATPIGALLGGMLAIFLNSNQIFLASGLIILCCGLILTFYKKFRIFNMEDAKSINEKHI